MNKKRKLKRDKKIQKIKDSWFNFIKITKRESEETKEVIKILGRLLKGGEITNNEKEFLKHQSKDLARIVALMGLGVISVTIPIALEKILNKYGISIIPKEYKSEKNDMD